MTAATTDAGGAGAGRGGRVSRPRGREAVPRLPRGRDPGTVARAAGVAAAAPAGRRGALPAGGGAALATEPAGAGTCGRAGRRPGPARRRSGAGCRPGRPPPRRPAALRPGGGRGDGPDGLAPGRRAARARPGLSRPGRRAPDRPPPPRAAARGRPAAAGAGRADAGRRAPGGGAGRRPVPRRGPPRGAGGTAPRPVRGRGPPAPSRAGAPRGPRGHGGATVPGTVDAGRGAGPAATTAGEGRAAVLVAVDHRPAGRGGIRAPLEASRLGALGPLRQGSRRHLGGLAEDVARGPPRPRQPAHGPRLPEGAALLGRREPAGLRPGPRRERPRRAPRPRPGGGPLVGAEPRHGRGAAPGAARLPRGLLLPCHELTGMGGGSKLRRQQGQRGRRRISATARCRRKVAIDAGLCRSGRTT